MKNKTTSVVAVLALVLSFGCRTSKPVSGEHPLTPLAASSTDETMRALIAERASLAGARALMRVRAPIGDAMQTFKASVDVSGDHMELNAFTPLGTTAMSITVDGEKVHFHDALHRLDWDGSTEQLAKLVPLFPPNVKPADMAWLLLGFPGSDAIHYTSSPAGLSTATTGNVNVTFDPPAHPPQHVVITNGAHTVDVTLLEVAVR